MSRYKAYAEYKDSGVEWADKLPANWRAVHLRWISTLYAGGTPSKAIEEYWENGSVPWLNSGEVNQGLIKEASTLITVDAYRNSSAKWIPKGALVMALAGQGKTKGTVAQLAIDATCNQSMAAIVPYELIGARYLYWWLTANYQNIRNMAGGDLRDGLNLELLGDIGCPIPNDDERNNIADFLDHEMTKIDFLIEKQLSLIALLKEKRQAVISHAVTKGLNPNAPMKDSGVEWLGEVPEHWDILKGAYIGRLFGSEAISDADVVDDGNIPFIKVSTLGLVSLELANIDFYLSKQSEQRVSASENYLVFPKRGAAIFTNKVNFVTRLSVIDPNLMGWKINDIANPEYIAHLLKLRGLSDIADVSTVPQINNKHIEPIKFPVPPIQEQSDILFYLNTTLSKFSDLAEKAEEAIELAQERRTALISAAVTGKIDVRDWRPA